MRPQQPVTDQWGIVREVLEDTACVSVCGLLLVNQWEAMGELEDGHRGDLWGVHKEATVVAWCLKESIADRRGWKHC